MNLIKELTSVKDQISMVHLEFEKNYSENLKILNHLNKFVCYEIYFNYLKTYLARFHLWNKAASRLCSTKCNLAGLFL